MCILYHIYDDPIELRLDATQAGDAGSLAHLRNAYIETIAFHTGAERCVPLLCGASDAFNFVVGGLYYLQNLQETETLHRSVDWIVRDVRVIEYELFLCDHDGDDNITALLPTIFTHDLVRATAEHLRATVFTRSRAPVIFERLFDLLFDAPKLTAVFPFRHRDGDVTEFTEGFIRRFIAANDISRIARRVAAAKFFNTDEPHNYLPKICTGPRKLRTGAWNTSCFDEKLPASRYDAQKCDLYIFKNSASGRELQLYAMTLVPKIAKDVRGIFIMMLEVMLK